MLALRTGAAQTIETLTEVLSQVPAGPWAYTPQSAIALPIKSNVPHRPAGALVLGISACIRFDPLYSSFLELLAGQIATAVANARAYAEEHRRAAAGRIQSSFAPVDLATLTADLSSTFRSAMERAGLQFEVECEPTRTYVQEALRWRRESERRETQEALKRQHELEAADRHKNEFLAMLAHELRNPLAPIRNANELLLRRFADDPSVRDTLGTVSRQVTHLTRLVDDLLDISRITLGHIDLRRRAVALADLVNRAIETIDPLLRQKGLRIAVVSSRQPLVADADPERITQCIGNILTNAVKYTDAPGEIRIETGEVDGQARVTVTDNGVGISSELLPRVFDLFVQGECTLDRSQGGLGIGLSIVRRIVEMHGGSVSVRSPGVNKGATFEIRLPLAQHAETHAGTRAANAALPSRILVVDDNADAARTLSSLLALDGHTVQIAFAGPQALEGVESFSPDVVLLDIGLPGIDGYEVARRIRDHHPRPIHLVALTGYGQEADRERARAAGFADHLVKPVEYSKLQQTLAAITAGSCRDK
jgi:CheY-like chemotaxis protein